MSSERADLSYGAGERAASGAGPLGDGGLPGFDLLERQRAERAPLELGKDVTLDEVLVLADGRGLDVAQHGDPDVDPFFKGHLGAGLVAPGALDLFGDLCGGVGAGLLGVVVEGGPVALALDAPYVPSASLPVRFCPWLRPALLHRGASPVGAGLPPAGRARQVP
jgi:hypothetical protein